MCRLSLKASPLNFREASSIETTQWRLPMHVTKLSMTLLVFLACNRASADDTVSAVELFEAMNAGQVSVKFIPTNAAKANVLIENLTDQVLHIELPDAIAAVPVLAQFGPAAAGGDGGNNGGGQTQGVGGGLNAGNGMQGQGFGNAFGQRGGGNNAGRGGARTALAWASCGSHPKRLAN